MHDKAHSQEYIEAILALQAKHPKGTTLPLAIMTSGDTHDRTLAFLRENKYFGAKVSQITLVKQEKVHSQACERLRCPAPRMCLTQLLQSVQIRHFILADRRCHSLFQDIRFQNSVPDCKRLGSASAICSGRIRS